MKISIITVAFNEEKTIEKTIKSVLNQTSKDLEFIICDGKSTDKTIEIAEGYRSRFKEKGIEFIINSEKDAGIYDGMNIGIKKATGDYIFFLNSGDWFYKDDVIEKIINVAEANSSPDLIYGKVATVERNIVKFVCGDDSRLQYGMSIPHQSLFSRTTLMKSNIFDLQYHICADYDFILRQKKESKKFCKTDIIVAYFAVDGISSKNIINLIKESVAIKQKYGFDVNIKLETLKSYKEQIIVQVKKLIPQKLWELWSVKVRGKKLFEADDRECIEK